MQVDVRKECATVADVERLRARAIGRRAASWSLLATGPACSGPRGIPQPLRSCRVPRTCGHTLPCPCPLPALHCLVAPLCPEGPAPSQPRQRGRTRRCVRAGRQRQRLRRRVRLRVRRVRRVWLRRAEAQAPARARHQNLNRCRYCPILSSQQACMPSLAAQCWVLQPLRAVKLPDVSLKCVEIAARFKCRGWR